MPRKFTYEQVKQKFADRGFELISDSYVDAKWKNCYFDLTVWLKNSKL
jgi:hypothetical protein